jgi:hypothetical protein
MRRRHDEHNALKDRSYCVRLRMQPLNPGESGAAYDKALNEKE